MNLKNFSLIIARHASIRELLSAVIASEAKQSRMPAEPPVPGMPRFRHAFPSCSFADKSLVKSLLPCFCDFVVRGVA